MNQFTASPFDADLLSRAAALIARYRQHQKKLVTAESCTGGLLAGLLTEIAGSSDVLERGYVTYSNEAKHEAIGVPTALIHDHGAVSEAVARAMAEGALKMSRAHVSLAITGVAGPGGGTALKPVGLVHLACAGTGVATAHLEKRFIDNGRAGVRRAALLAGLELLADQLVVVTASSR